MPSVLSSPVGGFHPTKSFPIRGVITMLPALSPTQTVSRSDGRRSASPDCRIQWHRYRASPPFASRTSASRTQGTQRPSSMLGSAVSSSTPNDFQPSSHMGVAACPAMNRHAPPGLPWGCPYPAVGMQSALESAIGLPRRSTSASWILVFLMPADVRRSFIGTSFVRGFQHTLDRSSGEYSSNRSPFARDRSVCLSGRAEDWPAAQSGLTTERQLALVFGLVVEPLRFGD